MKELVCVCGSGRGVETKRCYVGELWEMAVATFY